MASSVIMRNFKKELINGSMDLDSNTFYVALLSGTNTVSTATFETMINFSAAQIYETSGSGYTAGGIPLTADPIFLNGSVAVWDCLDASWYNTSVAADGAVIYKRVSNANNSPLVCFLDLYNISPVGYKSSNNGEFTIRWNTSGIINV